MSLILTLTIDSPSHQHFTALRNRYFPAWCNYLEAHITLFHQLPADNDFVMQQLAAFAQRAPFSMEVIAVKNIGNGVAYAIASPELMQLHAGMQQAFAPYLISQDRHRIWPHITVQNKVTAFKALQTAQELQADFIPFAILAQGFSLFSYEKGPWRHLRDFMFIGEGHITA